MPTLVAAEFPILAVEATLAALASFTLVAPLGLPWWLPFISLAVIGAASAGLRHLALREARELWRGLAVVRKLRGGSRVVGFVLVAVFAQIFRNWMLLHAGGLCFAGWAGADHLWSVSRRPAVRSARSRASRSR